MPTFLPSRLRRDDDLKVLARKTRQQIDGRNCDTAFLAGGIADVEKIGLAYVKDKVEIATER